ncbi:MAG: septum formation inhibitor Maf [Gemmatimonadaceae bacterium]|nr:septum formation inhibitor Maf [Gemmatimonadaceae bacterium]
MTLPRVVLASSSPRRRDLLNLIGIGHDVRPADLDETYMVGEEPKAHAERLARAKAEAIAAAEPESLVIGADTVVVIDGAVLGKPRDAAEALRMLSMLEGRTHSVLTGIAAVWQGTLVSRIVSVDVTFKPLTGEELSSYIATGEPMDKAGAYGIQGYGATIVSRIEGDYFAVMGLSLVALVALINELGLSYDFPR